MAISGAASKVAKKFQNSKINQKLTKKLDDVTSSLKSKTKNITANIAKKTKEATQKAVNTVSDKAKTIANKTLSGTNTVKNAISNGIKNAPKGEKNKVASVIDSLGEGILSVRNVFAPQKVINAGPIKIAVKDIKTGFGQSGEETLSQFLSKDVKKLKTMFFSQGSEGAGNPKEVKKLKEWLSDDKELLDEVTEWYKERPEWWSIDPDNTDVFYRTQDEVKEIRKKAGESGGHHPHGLGLGGPEGQKLTPTGETAKVKNPTHSKVTGLQRRVINRIKKKLK